MHFDLRSGKYERRFAHTDCVNALTCVGNYLISGGDDKLVRVTDLRKASYVPLGSHRVRSTVFSLAADDEAIYAGLDGGDVRVLDFSPEANPINTEGAGHGFSDQQKAALAQALSAVNRRPRGAHQR